MHRYLSILFFVVGHLYGQDNPEQTGARFLYVQSDPSTVFSIGYNGVIRSSSTAGYLILSGLPASEVELSIRLQGEFRYRIDLIGGDKGFSLRMRNGRWGLQEVGTDKWLQPISTSSDSMPIEPAAVTPFARLLSKAAQDPSLLVNDKKVPVLVSVQEPVLSSKEKVELGRDVLVDTVVVKNADKKDSVVFKEEVVSVLSEGADSAWRSVYYMAEGDGVDTVVVYIEGELSSKKTAPLGDRIETEKKISLPVVCALELTEPEFLQLRSRMAGGQDEEEMLGMVRKQIRNHCFSISQTRRLCNMFLYDDTRYRFFELIHGHVSDPLNFPDLQTFLTDPIYQKRFQELMAR